MKKRYFALLSVLFIKIIKKPNRPETLNRPVCFLVLHFWGGTCVVRVIIFQDGSIAIATGTRRDTVLVGKDRTKFESVCVKKTG